MESYHSSEKTIQSRLSSDPQSSPKTNTPSSLNTSFEKKDKHPSSLSENLPEIAKAAEGFFSLANKENGLIVSTCTFPTSGCQDFGVSLKLAFPNLDYVQVSQECPHSLPEVRNIVATKDKAYRYLFYTGCITDTPAFIISQLAKTYNFKELKSTFLIVPPHLSVPSEYSSLLDTLRNDFKSEGNLTSTLPIQLVPAGVDPVMHIGFPVPFPKEAESKKIIDEDVYGLMYLSYPNYIQSKKNPFLNHYFSQVALAAKAKGAESIRVIVIDAPHMPKFLIHQIASRYAITIEYSGKLPQADFIETIKQVAKKNGIMAFDGALSFLQTYYLGGKAFIHTSATFYQNMSFWKQIADNVPSDLRNAASVVLGLSSNYSALNDVTVVGKVFEALHLIIRRGVDKFENEKAKYVAIASESLAMPASEKSLYASDVAAALKSSVRKDRVEGPVLTGDLSGLSTSSIETPIATSVVNEVTLSPKQSGSFYFFKMMQALERTTLRVPSFTKGN